MNIPQIVNYVMPNTTTRPLMVTTIQNSTTGVITGYLFADHIITNISLPIMISGNPTYTNSMQTVFENNIQYLSNIQYAVSGSAGTWH